MQYKLQKQVWRRHGLDRKRFTFPPKLLIFSVSSLWQSLWGYTFKICYSENILGHYCISFQELLFWFMWHIDGGNPPYPCHAEGCVSSLLRLPRPEEAKNCAQPLFFFKTCVQPLLLFKKCIQIVKNLIGRWWLANCHFFPVRECSESNTVNTTQPTGV